jgi:hypothetical protein
MTEPRPSFEELGDELRSLGANLRQVLQAAWESDERRRAQEDIERGLDDLARTLRTAGQEFAASPTGQRLRDDVRDLHERLRSSEVDARVREELLAALRRVNEELGKAAAPRTSTPPAGESGTPEETP